MLVSVVLCHNLIAAETDLVLEEEVEASEEASDEEGDEVSKAGGAIRTLTDLKIDFDQLKKYGTHKYVLKMPSGPAAALIDSGSFTFANSVTKEHVVFKTVGKMIYTDESEDDEDDTMEYDTVSTATYKKSKSFPLVTYDFKLDVKYDGDLEAQNGNVKNENGKFKLKFTEDGENTTGEMEASDGIFFDFSFLQIIPFVGKKSGDSCDLKKAPTFIYDGFAFEDVTVTCRGAEKIKGVDCVKYELSQKDEEGKPHIQNSMWYSGNGVLAKYSDGDDTWVLLRADLSEVAEEDSDDESEDDDEENRKGP